MFVAACGCGLLLLVGSVASAGAANGDPKAGSNVFESSCGDCHSVKPGRHKSGPSLFGVVGRSAAAAEGYAYSEAMRGSNLVWEPEQLDAFIASPKAVVAQSKMRFPGLQNERSRADLLAFLASQK